MRTKAEQAHPLALLTGIIGRHLPSDSFPGPGSLQTHWESAHCNPVPLSCPHGPGWGLTSLSWQPGCRQPAWPGLVSPKPRASQSHVLTGASRRSPGQHKPSRPFPLPRAAPTHKAAQPSRTAHHLFMTIKRPQRTGKRLAEVTSPDPCNGRAQPVPQLPMLDSDGATSRVWCIQQQFQPWFPLRAGCQQRGPRACRGCFIFPPKPHLQSAG